MGRNYNIEFNHLRILQIKGKASTGKSLFVSDFKEQMRVRKDLQNSLVINWKNPNDINLITDNCKYDYVLIDNADVLMTEEISRNIEKNLEKNSDTYWIIIGRRDYDCILSIGCIGELCSIIKGNKKYFYIDYNTGL